MRGVRPPEPRWLAYAALSMVAIVACFAVIMFSQRLEVGSEASTILTAAHLPGASHAYDGSDGHPTKNGYPAVPAEEAEAGDKNPVTHNCSPRCSSWLSWGRLSGCCSVANFSSAESCCPRLAGTAPRLPSTVFLHKDPRHPSCRCFGCKSCPCSVR